MWVEEVSAEDLIEEQRRWEQAYELQKDQVDTIGFAVPPGPLHIIVPWLENWAPSVLVSELDSETRSKYLLEKFDYSLP